MASKNRLYPHLSAQEIEIWERFLNSDRINYDHIDYDVRVGTPVIIPEGIPDNIAEDARHLSLKRIDAVGWIMGVPTVIEIKTYAGFKALGQAIGYPILLAKQQNLKEVPSPLVITNKMLPDMPEIYDLAGIDYIEI